MASSFVFPDEMQARVTSASSSSSSTIACLRSRILLEGRKTDDDGKIKKSEQIEYQFSLPEMHKVRRKGLVLGSDEIRGEFQMDLAAFEISVDENKLDTYKLAVKDSKFKPIIMSREGMETVVSTEVVGEFGPSDLVRVLLKSHKDLQKRMQYDTYLELHGLPFHVERWQWTLPIGCHVIREGGAIRGGGGVIFHAGMRGLNGTLPYRLGVMKALQASTPTTYGNTNVAEAEQAKAVALSELRGYQEICPAIYGSWKIGGMTYLFMQKMDITLREFIELNKNDTKTVISKFYEALDKCRQLARDFGMTQVDMKLENLMLDEGGNVKIVDVGGFILLVNRAIIQGTTEAWTTYEMFCALNAEHPLAALPVDDFAKTPMYQLSAGVFYALTGVYPLVARHKGRTFSAEELLAKEDVNTLQEVIWCNINRSSLPNEIQQVLAPMMQLDAHKRPSYEEVLGSLYWLKLVPFTPNEIEAIREAVVTFGASNMHRLFDKVKGSLVSYRTPELVTEYARFQLTVDLINEGNRDAAELVERRIRLFDALTALYPQIQTNRKGFSVLIESKLTQVALQSLLGTAKLDGWMIGGIIGCVIENGVIAAGELASHGVMKALLKDQFDAFMKIPISNITILLEDVVRVCDSKQFKCELIPRARNWYFEQFERAKTKVMPDLDLSSDDEEEGDDDGPSQSSGSGGGSSSPSEASDDAGGDKKRPAEEMDEGLQSAAKRSKKTGSDDAMEVVEEGGIQDE